MTETPFTIHALTPHGISVATRSITAINTSAVTLLPGDTLDVTEEIYELNSDRYGDTWLAYCPEKQVEVWGEQRFGLGPVPDSVLNTIKSETAARLRDERQALLRGNPTIAKANAAARKLAELNRQLGE